MVRLTNGTDVIRGAGVQDDYIVYNTLQLTSQLINDLYEPLIVSPLFPVIVSLAAEPKLQRCLL